MQLFFRSSSNLCSKFGLFCMTSQLELFCIKFSAKSATLLFCFIRDSAACRAEWILWSLVKYVVSIDSMARRSRFRISAIFCSAARETSRLASWVLSRSSKAVWLNCRIVSFKSFSLVRLITASAMISPFSLSAASSSKITSWLLWSVTMQRCQKQHWHRRQ